MVLKVLVISEGRFIQNLKFNVKVDNKKNISIQAYFFLILVVFREYKHGWRLIILFLAISSEGFSYGSIGNHEIWILILFS